MARFGSVGISPSRMKAVVERAKAMTRKRCFVGIPSEAAAREDGSTINNAQIGFINEFGMPEKNIPARPHLVPGVRRVDKKMVELLADGGKRALTDDNYDPTTSLEKSGLVAISSVKELITDGLSPPLSPATIAGRRRGKEDEPGALPLIDTGNYMAHLTYVVRDNKGK